MSLTSTVEEMMTPRLLGRMASESGLSEAKVKNGMSGAVASIFGGLAGKASDRSTMGRVADLVSSSPDIDLTMSPDRVLDDTAPAKASSNALLGLATGDSQNLTTRLASMLGIGAKAAGGLVAAASTLALAAFKKLGRTTGGLDASTLASTLIDERSEINAKVPSGMLASTGYAATARDRTADTTIRDRAYDRDYSAREEVDRAPSRAWWWLAALIPIALLGYWLYNRSRTEPVRTPVVTPPAAIDTTDEPERNTVRDQPATAPDTLHQQRMRETTPPATNQPSATPQPAVPSHEGMQPSDTTPQPQTEPSTNTNEGDQQPGAMDDQGGTVPSPQTSDTSDLPQHSGGTPTSPSAGPTNMDTTDTTATTPAEGSVEAKLQAQIEAPSANDKTTWIELDQVTFATGRSTLEATSAQQIEEVAAILKEHPNVKVRVGGYTDSTGDNAANMRLSEKRADAVKQALVAQGVDANQIETKGFADENKVEQTAGASQANRRAAIRILSRGEG
ncbi:MAG: OmpA family protein [Kofleriaceae bacterium]|nr:OmpA family protein [Kofleriaceae bacterium]